jgi:hypothetical protein
MIRRDLPGAVLLFASVIYTIATLFWLLFNA